MTRGRDIRHVFLTRFNLATSGREVAHRLRPGWLAERFDLFERYCLPAMAAQIEQDFRWIVYFDVATPDWARDRIERARAVRDFHPCYTALFDNGGWARTTLALLGDDTGDALLTSNLDNDDGLAVDYVARVQEAARAAWTGEAVALNVTEGFVLHGDALYRHRHTHNAFTNLLEPVVGARTVNTISHMEMIDHVPIVQVGGPGGWLQVVHGDNVSNRVRGRRVDRAEADARFAPTLVADVRDPGAGALLLDRLAFGPVRALREVALMVRGRLWSGIR